MVVKIGVFYYRRDWGVGAINENLLIYNLSMNANSTLIRTFSIEYFCMTLSIIK